MQEGYLHVAVPVYSEEFTHATIVNELPALPSCEAEWWTPRLAWPIIAAALARLALLAASLARVGVSALTHADTTSYLLPGRNLLLYGHFVADGAPDLVRTPGYPLFLAITSLAGLPAAALANVILSVFCVLLTWKLARAVFGDDRIALAAAWIFAFEPLSIANSGLLISDTLFVALFLLSQERLAVFLRGHRLRVLAVAGLWLAAATFVRPVTYYLPVALSLGLFLVLARVPGLRWKAPAVLLVSVLPWLAAWQMRNWVETGYRGFSSITDSDLYFIGDADVTARVEHRSLREVHERLGYTGFDKSSGQDYLLAPYLARHPEQAGWSQGQRLGFMHSEAVRVIRAHYGDFLRSCLAALPKPLLDPSAAPFDLVLYPEVPKYTAGRTLSNQGWFRGGIALVKAYPWIVAEKAAFGVVLLGLYLLAARGLFRAGMQNPCLWLLLGTSLYFLAVTAAVTGPTAESRFRLPIMPAVCILAAAGVRRTKTVTR